MSLVTNKFVYRALFFRFSDRTEFRQFDVITLAKDQRVWMPDTFFQNERSGWYHMLDQENKFVRIQSDGKVIYNRRSVVLYKSKVRPKTYHFI